MVSLIKNILGKFARSLADANIRGITAQSMADACIQSKTARWLAAVSIIAALTCCTQQQQGNPLEDSAARISQLSADAKDAHRWPQSDSGTGIKSGKPSPKNLIKPQTDTTRTPQSAKALPDSFDPVKQSLMTVKLANPPKEVRGVYVSSYAATTPSKMRHIQTLLDRTELNAVVLDINSGSRLLALPSRGSTAYVSADSKGAKRLRNAIRGLKQRDVYLIARVVTFKDSALVTARPEWAIRSKNGSVWRDRKGHAWIDPFKEEAWPYYEALAAEAAKAGFDEVQFDYVRFPENGAKVDREVIYANEGKQTKSRIISRFVRRVTDSAHRHGIRVSADIFGMVGSSGDDMGIGQRWKDLAPATDVLSPMIYPSHYAAGIWGIRHPDLAPASIIAKALQDAAEQNRALKASGTRAADVRPWLQSFTASWIHPHQPYGPKQIREQIQAVRSAGFHSYLLWNSACRYPFY